MLSETSGDLSLIVNGQKTMTMTTSIVYDDEVENDERKGDRDDDINKEEPSKKS